MVRVSTILRLANGERFSFSPAHLEKCNLVVIDHVDTFSQITAPGARILHLQDCANNIAIHEREWLAQLGVPDAAPEQLPDALLYDEEGNRLYLFEINSSVLSEHRDELERLFAQCTVQRTYVFTFPGRDE
jgi:hypothetical protein